MMKLFRSRQDVRRAGVLCLAGLGLGLFGCKDLAGTPPLPAGTSTPSHTAAGAVQMAVFAQVAFQNAFGEYISASGEMTDELLAYYHNIPLGASGAVINSDCRDVIVDARLLDQAQDWNKICGASPTSTDKVYTDLQYFRGAGLQAIGSLAAYAPDSTALRGQMYALLGYAEVMLGDLFCSGVPLSTLDFQGGYTYGTSLTTAQVYQDAIAKFDTALTLVADSGTIANVARVGIGRAYLAMGDYAQAGQVVSTVPADFQFADSLYTDPEGNGTAASATEASFTTSFLHDFVGVSDREGGTGLPFVSSNDPRTAVTALDVLADGDAAWYFPTKYNIEGLSALVLASGLEAQLISAEAELNAQNPSGAFAILNALRTTNSVTAGQLPPLTDPGTFGAEVDTLFTERAAWLFVDGHRQGDLRRLIRNYVHGQGVQVVANQYPSQNYPELGAYGSFIDAPVPAVELPNPHFTGCLSRD